MLTEKGYFCHIWRNAGLGVSCYKPMKMARCLCAAQNFPPRLVFSKAVSNFGYPNLDGWRLPCSDTACPWVWALGSPKNSFSSGLCLVASSSPCPVPCTFLHGHSRGLLIPLGKTLALAVRFVLPDSGKLSFPQTLLSPQMQKHLGSEEKKKRKGFIFLCNHLQTTAVRLKGEPL